MLNNTGNPGLKSRTGSVKHDMTKQPRTAQNRRVPYRVGYSWNKGGRLKELRIRHLARKFLKIWIQNTFGRVLPHKAKSHYRRVILKRALEGWQEEWWTARKEWSLTLRAECHFRYSLYNWTFHRWRDFVLLQREKKLKIQNAQLFADKQQLCHVLDRWEDFTKIRKIKRQNLESALQYNKHITLNSAWSIWQGRLLHVQHLYMLEDKALKQQKLASQHKVLLHWKEMHTVECNYRENESRASQHNIIRLKRKAFDQWLTYVSCCRTKSASKVVAENTCYLRLMRMCWNKWCQALYQKWTEEVRLEAAGHLAVRICQRRVLNRWKAYVKLRRQKAESSQQAHEHHHHRLLRAALCSLSLSVNLNKAKRLNNNVAIQHYRQTIIGKYWRLWQERLEEAEDKGFQPLAEKANAIYSIFLSRNCFHHWREKLAEFNHTQTLAYQADMLFAEHVLPRCFQSWFNFTREQKIQKQRKGKAESYNRERQHSWVFYTWRRLSEKHKQQKLAQQMAIFHEEQSQMHKAWKFWRKRTEIRIKDREKRDISDKMYLHRLLQKTVMQWKENSAEIRDRRNREQQACHQGDLCYLRWAVGKWKKFVQMQKAKKSQAEKMQQCHEVKLLKCSFAMWKKHTLQMYSIYAQVEELHKQQTQKSLRRVLAMWWKNAADSAKFRFKKQQAQNHYRHVLQLKVFCAWREVTLYAVTRHHQQREALSSAQQCINKGRLLHFFRRWQVRTRNDQTERLCWRKAQRHHDTQALSKALKAWKKHHEQCHKYKVMKRQGNLLLRLKIWQTFFDQWKLKLQHRQREAKQTEQALWHWALTLQAKVLYAWRLYVAEQRREREEVAKAAQFYRDQLLREGVSCILTYAAHMNDLTATLTQHSQEQQSRRLQKVVFRCAMKWKHQALCKTEKYPEAKGQPRKKSVTFSLPETKRDSLQQEAGDKELIRLLNRMPRCHTPPTPEEFESPATAPQPLELSCSSSAIIPMSTTHQSSNLETVSPSELHMSSVESTQNQERLLPPSAFMTATPFSLRDPPLQLSHQVIPTLKNDDSDSTVIDPVSDLTNELLSIQQDMRSYQQDRKQLRTWHKLKDVLQTWLQTSGQDDQYEKNTVSQELEELETAIVQLTTKLAKRKPTILQLVERIQHLQVAHHTSGDSFSTNHK